MFDPSFLCKSLKNVDTGDTLLRNGIPCAVMILIFKYDGNWSFVLTKRSETLKHHRGEISFPGGIVESHESNPVLTAVRELEEELGISGKDIDVLGTMTVQTTLTSGYTITPVVSLWRSEPPVFKANTAEVQEVIIIPLHIIRNAEVDLDTADYRHYPHPVYQYKNHIIWGATARIIETFLQIIHCETK